MRGDFGIASLLMLFVVVAVFAMGWYVGSKIGKRVAGSV